jgi:tRNA dimethylallyltransferase
MILVGGPTASGKSALARAIAEAFGGWVINADSMQVYRDLRILTARPDPAEEARVPHRLYGVLDGADPCSAARWRVLALDEISVARREGALPVLVGGTGLYFRALTKGLAAVPEIPIEVRRAARSLHEEIGGAGFHAALAARDPGAAARLAPGDTQRLLRAWEVVVATGRPLAEWQRGLSADAAPQAACAIVLLPPRAELYAACDARLAAMVERGALDEVKALIARRLDPALPVMKALGVRELAAHLRGEATPAEAVARAQQATRHYAKRQFTWFRHQMPEAKAVKTQFSERIAEEIFSFIRRFLLTRNRAAV